MQKYWRPVPHPSHQPRPATAYPRALEKRVPTRCQRPALDVEGLITYVTHLTVSDPNLPCDHVIDPSLNLEAHNGLEPHHPYLRSPAGDQPLTQDANAFQPRGRPWPRMSVVVCCHRGSQTIRDTLEGLTRIHYPAYEVIVIDDGSIDTIDTIVHPYGYRLVNTAHRGLSNARNTGMQAAQGEIVAYIDDDVYPDPHWLRYLAETFIRTNHAGVGGPHLAPANGDWIADCIAQAPGQPVHVLLADRGAEHIPGCNMAFRKSTLQSIGGFDPRYGTAGDDIDACWRLKQRGWTLGFHPHAVVWRHRHHPVRTYWHQQKSHGHAEALLEEKWPLKYRELGHLAWTGQLDGQGITRAMTVRHGHLHSLCHPAPDVLYILPLMPVWYLLVGTLAVLAVLGLLWSPLLYSIPLLLLAIGLPLGQAAWRSSAAVIASASSSWCTRIKCQLLTTSLYLLQPIARWAGRLSHRFLQWRGHQQLSLLRPRTISLWRDRWQDETEILPFSRHGPLRCGAHNAPGRPSPSLGSRNTRWALR